MDNLAKLTESLLFQISNLLYIPVIVGVAALCFYMTVQLGMFAREWLQRRKAPGIALHHYQQALQQTLSDTADLADTIQQAHIERLLQSTELQLVGQLDRVRFIIRTGPALGLMGTLIPMGTSLAALAEGNIPNMAGNMVTAFTATVAGLGCSVLAYLVSLAREKWLRTDIREMEFYTEVHMQSVSNPTVPYAR